MRDLVQYITTNHLKGSRHSGSHNISAKCPFHKGGNERNPSFSISLTTGRWICFAGCGSGNIRELLSRMGLSQDLADGVQEWIPPQPEGGEVNELPIGLLGIFNRCPVLLLNLGFDESVMQQHYVGYDLRPSYSRITWPIFSSEGNLVGISGGTTIGGTPKYLFYTDRDLEDYIKINNYALHKGEWLWREDKAERNTDVFLAEGFKACLWLVQHGYNAVASMGAQITSAQISKLLSWNPTRIYLFLDGDDAGITSTRKMLTTLCSRGAYDRIRVCGYPNGKIQPDQLTGDELSASIEKAHDIGSYLYQ